MHPKRRTKPPPQKVTSDYSRLWRIVDGAVADAFNNHANYIAPGVSKKLVRSSINKRVVGAILAAPKGTGPVEITPADRDVSLLHGGPS